MTQAKPEEFPIEYATEPPEAPPPEEVSAADREPAEEPEEFDPFVPMPGGRPAWCPIPKGFKPPQGVRVMFVSFAAETTVAPHKGDRSCLLWELSDIEELDAAKRSAGQPGRGPYEFAKQMIRVIDGSIVDWSGDGSSPGSIDRFWREIGPKGRSMLALIYGRTHAMDAKERVDFFTKRFVVRPAG